MSLQLFDFPHPKKKIKAQIVLKGPSEMSKKQGSEHNVYMREGDGYYDSEEY